MEELSVGLGKLERQSGRRQYIAHLRSLNGVAGLVGSLPVKIGLPLWYRPYDKRRQMVQTTRACFTVHPRAG
jgi:hypothetical protein